ncbi:hypothetical protein [Legionella brunensis]|nr:hypothetical protein [Legionella brunensis]
MELLYKLIQRSSIVLADITQQSLYDWLILINPNQTMNIIVNTVTKAIEP